MKVAVQAHREFHRQQSGGHRAHLSNLSGLDGVEQVLSQGHGSAAWEEGRWWWEQRSYLETS